MLAPVQVVEPRTRIRESTEKDRIVLNGGSLYTQYVEPASSLSNQNANFTINIQSEKTIVDRNFMLRAYVEFVADQPFQIGTNDAPRAFPLASGIENLDARINGTSNNDQISDRIHAHLCYGNDAKYRSAKWSTTTAMPDQYQVPSDWTVYGSARNPLSDYGENSAEMARGGFVFESLSIDQKTARYIFTEPLFLSPFLQGQLEEGLINIRDIIININWKSDLSVMWTHSSAGNAITNVAVTFYQKPEILYTQITPDMMTPMPDIQMLPYVKVDQFPRTIDQTVNAGVRVNGIVSNAIQIKEIPRYLLLFVRRSRATTNFTTSDTFARIDRVVVNWDNQSFLFNTTQQQQLYDMAVENGCNLSYAQWVKHVGTPVLLEFGTQIGLKDGEAPSVLGSWTISTTIDFTNTSSVNVDYEFYMCFIRHGIVTIGSGTCIYSLGTLTRQEALDAKQQAPNSIEFSELQGGGLYSNLKSIVNKIPPKLIGQIADMAIPISAAVAPEITPGLVFGRNVAKCVAKEMTGQKPSGGMLRGGILTGGQCMPCERKMRFSGRRS